MALSVILAGGGTGGHIFPAIALADTIRRRNPDASVGFIGTQRGLETRYVPAAGYPLSLVASTQILGRNPLRAALGLLTVARGVWQARSLLHEANADLVVGVGGYASVPAVAAARMMGIPTALIEPNARPGRANRLLGRFAKRVFVQFEDAAAFFPPESVSLTGFPTRIGPELRETGRESDDKGEDSLCLLTVGGSQGARSLNRAMCSALPRLREFDELSIVHQTGPADLDEVRDAYAVSGITAEVEAFFETLPEHLMCADLVVARSGAATVAELCVAGVASILVPYPHAADDHQMANAREVERVGGCIVIPDSELGARLADEVVTLLGDSDRRRQLAAGAARRGSPDAADQIWDSCVALISGGAA
ncbi:MAG: undecaprenyldiphospho-muramoylpentapeptide beta-N-acetylglucosaminyltransferase [bacterium]|nr:undecaprenyldiphospho-muramoylpentapeptide beta-N-acetylglucosaminyltransferase [bacterium]